MPGQERLGKMGKEDIYDWNYSLVLVLWDKNVSCGKSRGRRSLYSTPHAPGYFYAVKEGFLLFALFAILHLCDVLCSVQGMEEMKLTLKFGYNRYNQHLLIDTAETREKLALFEAAWLVLFTPNHHLQIGYLNGQLTQFNAKVDVREGYL